MASTSFDDSELQAALTRLSGEFAVSLASRMAVAGGRVLRDEAKLRVPSKFIGEYNPTSRGSHAAGKLRDSIYVARNTKLTTETNQVYSVTWNARDGDAKNAFWGKFIEFGHYIKYAWYVDKNGVYHTIKNRPLKRPIHVPATPFLRPAFDSKLGDAKSAMIEAGRRELPKLLRGES